MQDDLSMILSGKLNLDATIKNINKQIGQIEKQLNDIDITLNVGNIEKVVSTVSKSAKVMTDTMTKELSQMDKVVNGIFRNLGIDKVSKELRDSLTQMLRGVANGTGDISEDIIARINKLAMESKKNIDYAKAQYKELNMAKISDGESIYNYMKEHKDGKSWGKIKPMSEEFKGIDGFKESLRGLISISNDATMTLENLHSEMAGANLLPKDVADMGNMQDFALYLRDTLNQYRKFREELNDNIKVPDMTDTVFNEIGDALPDIAKLENSFGEVNEEIIDTISNVEKLNQEISGLNKGGYQKGKVTESYSLINGENIKSRTTEYTNAELKDTVKIIEKIIDESNELVAVEKVYVDNIKKRNDEQEKLALSMSKGREKAEIKSGNLDRKEELKQANAINKALDEQYVSQEKLKTQIREIALLKKSAEASIDNIVKSNDGADVKRANELKTAISKVSPEAKDAKLQMREFNAVIKEYGVRSKEASSTTNSFSDSLKRFTAFYGLYDLFQLGKRGVESMLGSIFDLDHALVELQKTSNLTGGSLNSFIKESYQIAGDLARTGTEVIDAAGEFSKAGFGEGELANLAETALLLTNVGDGIKDVSDASGTLISAMKGFDIESRNAIDIVDKINAVSNSTASNFEDISFGLERMSGTLGMAGASIDETIGMFTAVNEVLRNSEIVSSGLSSTFMRMRGLSEETGESVDGLKSKLGDLYSTVGVDMMDQNGQLRDTFDVLDDLSKQWGSLSTNQKQYIATESAGIRQAKVFITLMEQWSTVQGSITTSLNSTGSAMSENEKYLNSLEGKVNNVKSAWEQLSATTINSNFVKGILDGIAGIIRFADALGGLVPIVSYFVGLLAIIKAQKISDWVGGLITSLKSVYSAMMGVNVATTSTATAMTTLQAATGWIGIAVMAISQLVMVTSALQQKQEQLNQEAIDRQKTYAGETDKINELVSKYKELSSVTDKTTEVKEELKSVQKELVEYFGSEASGLDLVNKSYEENTAIINKNIEARNKLASKDSVVAKQAMLQNVNKALEESFGRAFAQNISGLDQSQIKNMFEDLIEKMELSGETDSNKYKELLSNYRLYLDAIDEYNSYMIEVGESEAKANVERTKSSVQMIAQKNGIKDVTTATASQIKSLESLYVSQMVLSKGAMYAEQAQREFRDAMAKTNPQYAKSIGFIEDTTDASDDFAVKLDELKESTKGLTEDLNELDSAIETVREGKQLTAKTIASLIEKYPQLVDELVKTENGYTLNAEALEKVRQASIDMQRDAITSEINTTKTKLKNTITRIGIMATEIDAITSLSAAYKVLEGAKSSKGDVMFGNYRPASYTEEFSNEEKSVMDMVKRLGELQDELLKVDIFETQTNDTNGGDSKSNDPFKKDIDNIRKSREELEQEIAILQEKMNLANVMGDTSAFEEYSNKMSILLDKMRGLSAIEIGKLEGLKNTYKKQEQLAELETAIQEARKQGFIDERQYQEQMISLINTRYDLDKRVYDDKVRDLELEQLRNDDGSERYQQIEEEKYNMLLQLQQSYLDKIRQLQAMGLSQNQEDVRKYIDLYKDAEEEIWNKKKEMAEKKRQLEIDNLNKDSELASSQKDALKTLHDMTMKMIKTEQDAKKKAHQDQLKAYKDEIDARKKAIQDESDERDYQKGLKEKSDKVAEIEKELLELENNNSDKAIAEKIRLQEELKQAQDELADYQYKNEVDLRQEALDEEYKLFEEEKQKEIDKIEDLVNNEYELRRMANDKLKGMNNATYKELLEWNRKYGDGIDSSVIKPWGIANDAMKSFEGISNNVLDVMSLLSDKIQTIADTIKSMSNMSWTEFSEDIGKGGSTTGGGNDTQTLSKEGKEQLNQKVYLDSLYEQAKKDNNQGLRKWVEAERKKYDLDPITGRIIKQRHQGLLMGRLGDNMKPDELMLKATSDEWVFTGKQFDNLNKNLNGLVNERASSSITLNFDKFMDVDKLDSNVDMRSIVDTAIKEMYRSLKTNFALKGVF